VSEQRPRAERGSVTILMVAVVVVGCVLALGAARLGGAVIGRARADSAADASALAAADALALGDGAGAAQAAARATAASNDAHLVSCICAGTSAEVVVEVDVAGLGALGAVARGRAKAEVQPECVIDLPECR
jgi:DNA topoisomerase-1